MSFLGISLFKNRKKLANTISFNSFPATVQFINSVNYLEFPSNVMQWQLYGGINKNDIKSKRKLKSILSEKFQVHNSEEVIKQIDKLFIDEDSYQLNKTYEFGKIAPFAKKLNENTEPFKTAYEIENKFGDKLIKSVSLIRISFLAATAYKCGYISYIESIDYAIRACKELQEIFNSFDEVIENYKLGVRLTVIDDDKIPKDKLEQILSDTSNVIQNLKNNENKDTSPLSINWNTRLNRIELEDYEKYI